MLFPEVLLHRTCNDNLHRFYTSWHCSWNTYTGAVFIDISKAFDTVDHEILLNKLKSYGISGMELDWLKEYLRNRY